MSTDYSGILRLLRDDGTTFQERMESLGADTISDILSAGQDSVPSEDSFECEFYYTLIGKTGPDRVVCQAVDFQTQNDTHSVEFDWKKVWDRHVSHGDVVGWFHEHPPGAHWMSEKDWNTFQSWQAALDRVPRYAIIRCEGILHVWELTMAGIEMKMREVHAEAFGESGYIIRTEEVE